MSKNIRKYLIIIILGTLSASCASQTYATKPNQHTDTATNNSALQKILASTISRKPDTQAGFRLIHNGMEALASIIYLTNTAQKTLELQYWSLHQDQTGKLVIYHLLKAADRGVRVHLLLDDFVARGGNANLFTLSSHPNIEVKLYNPISRRKWLRSLSLMVNFNKSNRRMHNKVFIADNSVAIVGGRNIGDAYYIAKKSYLYRDLGVMTIGSAVPEISASFNAYWNAKWAVNIKALNRRLLLPIGYADKRQQLKVHSDTFMQSKYYSALLKMNIANKLKYSDRYFTWAKYKVLYDPPNKIRGIKKTNKQFLEYKMAKHMASARHSVNIITPYFVPQAFGLKWTRRLSENKVAVSVLTNSFAANDFSLSHGGYQRYRKKLLKNGVKLYEFKRNAMQLERSKITWFKNKPVARLHAKSIIIDNQYLYVGSVNLTPRSRYLNTEISIMIDSKKLANKLNMTFSYLTQNDNSYSLTLQKVEIEDEDGNQTSKYKVSWVGNSNPDETEPEVSMLKHFTISLLSLLPLEDLM